MRDQSNPPKYEPSKIESRWQKKWEKEKIYSPNLDTAKKPFYNLMMFPYPSAEGMHVGNMYAFTGADVYGRFQRMQGFSVFEPIGLDGFGIHSENYAIKTGQHPVKQSEISEKKFYQQLKSIGNAFDWTKTVETYKPEYYKWTQWLFIQLFKAGLAYRKKAPVNFCPSCKTVLADEQVLDGKCERCNSIVEKRDLEQWFFRITKYADRLLKNLEKLDWSERVKTAQKLWIGKSEGAKIRFKIDDLRFKNQEIDVFTTRQDTLYGATFLVLAPEHSISTSIKDSKVQEYIKKVKSLTGEDRKSEEKEKTGIFTGLYAINPLNQEKLPVWIADYALMDYGTGALFGDAHDERDLEFAKKYKIPLKATIITGDKNKDKRILNLEECFTGYGTLVDSGPFTNLSSKEALKKVANFLKEKGAGGPESTYHLRDWLISRQRYWGPPIPMIICEKCGWQPVLEKDLPVLLPYIEDYKPLGTGQAPLASHPEFYKTKCPNCEGEAKRETDVSDTFLDSAWYFLKYVSTDIDSSAFDRERVKKWLPVNMYIGGAEHSVLHLLYSRFITMALKDLGHISFEEPFTKFRAHGLIIKDGAKMSKSKGNVVVPDQYIAKYGADALRSYLMFAGPYSQGGDFRDTGIEGMHRFLRRVWNLVASIKYQVLSIGKKGENSSLDRLMHSTIKVVTDDIGNLNYNTAIAHLMEYYNGLFSFYTKYKILNIKYCKTLVLLLAPFAPHMTEELWFKLENKTSIHSAQWPSYEEKYLVSELVTLAVQINGRLRDTLKVQNSKSKVQSYVEQLAKQSDKINKYLAGKNIQKVIYVEGKVINFVVS